MNIISNFKKSRMKNVETYRSVSPTLAPGAANAGHHFQTHEEQESHEE